MASYFPRFEKETAMQMAYYNEKKLSERRIFTF